MVILQHFGFLFDLEHSSRKMIPQTLSEYFILLFFSYEFLRKHLSPQRFSIVFFKRKSVTNRLTEFFWQSIYCQSIYSIFNSTQTSSYSNKCCYPFSGFYCNFDRSQCGFVQRRDDKFDWTRKKGATSSGGTGPYSDAKGRGSAL